MFSIIKGFFGGLWGYLAIAAAAIAGVVSVYLSGRSAGRDGYEKDAAEALREAEHESSKDAEELQEKVDAVHKADHSSIDPNDLN